MGYGTNFVETQSESDAGMDQLNKTAMQCVPIR